MSNNNYTISRADLSKFCLDLNAFQMDYFISFVASLTPYKRYILKLFLIKKDFDICFTLLSIYYEFYDFIKKKGIILWSYYMFY